MLSKLWRPWRKSSSRSSARKASLRTQGRRPARLDVELLERRELLATWTPLTNLAPASSNGVGTMMLLTDGRVMALGGGVAKTWYSLTPDTSGSYINGAWAPLTSMGLERLYFGSNVLSSGKVFVLGGEYTGPGGNQNFINTGEIYDPISNSWSAVANFPQSQFGDDPTELLSNGLILAGYIAGPQTFLYNPATNAWSPGGTKLRGDASDEETWVVLPDDSILSYDVFASPDTGAGHAQRYIPATNTWVDAGSVPVPLSGAALGFELGPAFLLPDGRVFQLGANNNTALYTPSTNTWVAGPTLPTGMGCDDTPGAMMPNGHVIFAADHPLFNGPTQLFDFDPVANTIIPVATPPALTTALNRFAFVDRMLVLPNGDVLLTTSDRQLWEFTPDGGPNNAWRPTITSVVPTGPTFTVTGTQLNGLSEGASYGDDAEMSTNYPIVQLTSAGGTVYYARTFNWPARVATGATPVTTEFSIPAGVPGGVYSLRVIANGIASAPVSFNLNANSSLTGQVYEDLNGNGVRNGGEPPLSGWQVYLDFNLNGALDPGEPVVTSDAGGNYTFSNLTAGVYRVREVVQPGWAQSSADPADVGLGDSQTLPGGDFGNFRLATLTGAKFNDLNGDGVRQPGEPGLPGWTVFLDTNNNGVLDVTFSGTYTVSTPALNFQDISGTGTPLATSDDSMSAAIPLGFNFNYFGVNYSSVYVCSNGFITVLPGQPADFVPTALPDPTSANGVIAGWWTDLFTPAGGTVTYQTLGSAGSRVFIVQWTNVGHYPGGAGPSTFQIKLFEGSNVIEVHYPDAATDNNGHNHSAGIENETGTLGNQFFLGTGALPADTAVRYTPQFTSEPSTITDASGNYTFSALGAGTFHVREIQQAGWVQTTPNPANVVVNVSGQTAGPVNIGNFKLVTISGTKFEDVNGNGVKNGGEPGLAGWVIFLDSNNNGTPDGSEPVFTSGPTGAYSFTNLGPGSYRVREVLRAGWAQTLGAPTTIAPVSGTDVVANIGNFQLYGITGQVFRDSNGNGTKEVGEPGLGAWVVFLDNNDDGLPNDGSGTTTTTTPGGNFAFNNVGPGAIHLREVLQAGWVQTTAAVNFTGTSGADRSGQNLGNFQLATIRGQAFLDLDGDGIHSPNETGGAAGFLIDLDRGADGTVDATATTDATGAYSFPSLGPGTYRVRERGVAGWIQTTLNPPDLIPQSGATVAGIDFGNFLRISIGGQVFNDLNGNGARDPGEPALAGWVIGLDQGADGTVEATATTDATGAYGFTSVGPGSYRVREVGQAGWLQTTTNPADVPAQSGQDASGLNFGNFQRFAVRGQVFNDTNGNGAQDSGEGGLLNWVVQLDKDANGTVDATATTDAAGAYTFPNLGPGTYRVREAGVAGWSQTTTNPGDVVGLSGANVAGVNFGNFQRVTVSGTAFNDLNGNGALDAGEPGLQGWVVQLDQNADGSVDATATTNASGAYSFPSLGPGTYRVREAGQAGWVQTTTNPADVVTQSGGAVAAANFGTFRLVTLSGTAFNDTNGNGAFDSGEPGLPGWVIQLDQNADGSVDATATTNASGAYSFPSLGPGTYRVREAGQAGWIQTTTNPADVAARSGTDVANLTFGTFRRFTIRGAVFEDLAGDGVRDAGDPALAGRVAQLDANGDGTPDTTATTDGSGAYSFANLGPGTYRVREAGQVGWVQTTADPADVAGRSGQDAAGLDFGSFRLTTIAGRVFEDTDGDATPDAGEPGLAGWVVFLDANANGTLDGGEASATTGAGGTYSFTNLGPGTYHVREQLQAGFVASTPPADVTLQSGTPAAGVVFGNFRLASISGTVFRDTNGNGVRDGGEPAQAGWVVFLDANNNGGLDPGEAAATTDANGAYSFGGLGAGTYRVREVVQAGWAQTTGPAPIVPTSGQNVTGAVLGNFQFVSITGTAFVDNDGNGTQNGTEPAAAGRVLFLDANQSGTVDPGEATATSAADGSYTFASLGAGTYRVREAPLSGWVQTSTDPAPIVPTSGQTFAGVNFGNFQLVALGGVTFEDIVGDGVRQGADAGLAGRVVFLDANQSGTLDPGEVRQTTAAGGAYQFTNLGPGTYRVRQVTPAGWVPTGTPTGVTVTSGQNVAGLDLGSFRIFTLSGQAFRDRLGNGVRDADDAGVAGRVVFLDANGNGGLDPGEAAATTDAAGRYAFPSLGPGTYQPRLAVSAGTLVTGMPDAVLGLSGQDATGLDFLTFQTVTAGGRIFHDANADGIDNGEPPLPGMPVTLARDADGDGRYSAAVDVVLATATSGPDGRYQFGALGPGKYLLVEGRVPGRTQTAPGGAYAFTAESGVDVAGRDFGNLGGIL